MEYLILDAHLVVLHDDVLSKVYADTCFAAIIVSEQTGA